VLIAWRAYAECKYVVPNTRKLASENDEQKEVNMCKIDAGLVSQGTGATLGLDFPSKVGPSGKHLSRPMRNFVRCVFMAFHCALAIWQL